MCSIQYCVHFGHSLTWWKNTIFETNFFACFVKFRLKFKLFSRPAIQEFVFCYSQNTFYRVYSRQPIVPFEQLLDLVKKHCFQKNSFACFIKIMKQVIAKLILFLSSLYGGYTTYQALNNSLIQLKSIIYKNMVFAKFDNNQLITVSLVSPTKNSFCFGPLIQDKFSIISLRLFEHSLPEEKSLLSKIFSSLTTWNAVWRTIFFYTS